MLVLPYLYAHWPYMCLPIALYSAIILFSCAYALPKIIVLLWLHFPAYLIHQFEEHAYPGGFNQYISKVLNAPITVARMHAIFWINSIGIWLTYPLIAMVAQHIALNCGVILPIFSLFNASAHIALCAKTREYNPGIFSSITIMMPLALYTLWYMYHIQLLTIANSTLSIISALCIHVLVFKILQRYR